MLATVELEYIQHLERGYCENHPDVVAGTKQQVVDRAVKQLLQSLQSNGFELDGNILKRGNGWLRYDAGSSAWQYSNDAGVSWLPMTQGTTDHTLLTNIGVNTHAQIDTHLADAAAHVTDHTLLTNIGVNTHAQIDTHLASNHFKRWALSNPTFSSDLAGYGFSPLQNTAKTFVCVANINVDAADAIFFHYQSAANETIMRFGVDYQTGDLFLELGGTRYVSPDFANNSGPQEYGFMLDPLNTRCAFLDGGYCNAWTPISPTYPSFTEAREIIGPLTGTLYFAAMTLFELLFTPETWHTPRRKGRSQWRSLARYWPLDEGQGSAISGLTKSFTLTAGSWVHVGEY